MHACTAVPQPTNTGGQRRTTKYDELKNDHNGHDGIMTSTFAEGVTLEIYWLII